MTNVVEDFINTFATVIMKLLQHHYISKKQSSYFKECKDSLMFDEGILVGDFSENYSLVVLDAAQGFHWENSQCTLHPFVFYYGNEDLALAQISFCFISDSLKHSTAMVHTFVKKLIPYIKDKYPQISKLIYFSGGCSGQYKNRYNFINLLHHEADFGLQAEWNFFATSHGKNACNGIGGALKRSAAKASLLRPLDNQIVNPLDFYNFCKTNVKNVKMFFVTADEAKTVTAFLAPHFAAANTIQGTQKHHRFIPINEKCLQIYQISSSNSEINSKIVKMMQDKSSQRRKCEEVIPVLTVNDLVGGYVCGVDSGKMWVAHVDFYNEEFDDYFVHFLHPSGVQKS